MEAKMIARTKNIEAYGKRPRRCVAMSTRNAKEAQMRLSRTGWTQCRGCKRDDPAPIMRERPAPSWIPFTTGIGTTEVAQRSKPVTLISSTAAPTHCPAATTTLKDESSRPEIAADAMALYHVRQHRGGNSTKGTRHMQEHTFMGCTGNGMPNTTPVRTLKMPENTKVDPKCTDPCAERAIISGNKVPRSPNEPEISAHGASRKVDTLCAFSRRIWPSHDASHDAIFQKTPGV